MSSLTIVTAASGNHGNSLVQLLRSIKRWERDAVVRPYDLGLSDRHRAEVEHLGYELIRFPYEKYPPHMNVIVNAGDYAWKPVVVHAEMQKASGQLLWMDAGNLVRWPMWGVRRAIRMEGIYAYRSAGTVAKWTHPKMYEALGLRVGQYGERSPLSSAAVGIDPTNPQARKVIDEWLAGALDKQVIAPDGSSRENHRQDQALLTLLVYRSGMKTRPSHRARSFVIHRDVPEVR